MTPEGNLCRLDLWDLRENDEAVFQMGSKSRTDYDHFGTIMANEGFLFDGVDAIDTILEGLWSLAVPEVNSGLRWRLVEKNSKLSVLHFDVLGGDQIQDERTNEAFSELAFEQPKVSTIWPPHWVLHKPSVQIDVRNYERKTYCKKIKYRGFSM